jgi:hypothetical protein
MEKIINIQFAGRNFHIQDDANALLQDYEKSIRQYFNDKEGGDEICNDLELRMGEILQELQKESISKEDVE